MNTDSSCFPVLEGLLLHVQELNKKRDKRKVGVSQKKMSNATSNPCI